MDYEDPSRIRRHLRFLRSKLGALRIAVETAPSEVKGPGVIGSKTGTHSRSALKSFEARHSVDGHSHEHGDAVEIAKSTRPATYKSRRKAQVISHGKDLNDAQFGRSSRDLNRLRCMDLNGTPRNRTPSAIQSELQITGSIGKLSASLLDSFEDALVKLYVDPTRSGSAEAVVDKLAGDVSRNNATKDSFRCPQRGTGKNA
ncbi:hypothetical protein HDU93_007077 [Gonapodya sp. JEL0774]|nr:hypothetical protein HDU93_007077 [Gonapodya sp. JEL0774]